MNGPSHLVLSTIPPTLPSLFAFGRIARPHMRAKSCWNQECQILLKFYYFGSNRDLTFGGHFATPVLRMGKQQKRSRCITRPHMHAKFHWNPSTFRHSKHCDELSALWRPFCHARFEYGFCPKGHFCWSCFSPQVYRFSFAYDKFYYFDSQ